MMMIIDKLRLICLGIIGLIFALAISWGVTSSPLQPRIEIPKNIYLPPHQDFRIVVISDLNSQYGATEYEPEVKQAIALMSLWQPDLVLCGGDMIAGQKATLTESQINAMWQAFDRQIAAPLRRQQIPFGFTIGNHDGSGAIKGQSLLFQAERDLAQAYWRKNQAQLGLNFVDLANFPFYYSFQQKDLFFLVWDASTNSISSEQLDWVAKTLKSDRAQAAQTIFAIGHLPLYPVAVTKNQPGEYLADGEALRSLLEANHVQVYLSGHHHAYYPGKKGQLELLHAGALGQGARQLIGSELPPFPSLTAIDWQRNTGKLTYTTYNAQTWEVLPLEKLPTSITGENGTIWRRDWSIR